jgi:hypothetical protein
MVSDMVTDMVSDRVSDVDISFDGIPDISNTEDVSIIKPRRNFSTNVKGGSNAMNGKRGKFTLPQAESTSINSNSSSSTLPPPEEMSSIQDVTLPYVSKWAHLSSMSIMFNSKDINEDVFEFGKNINADLVSAEGADIMTSVSNHHFRIERNGQTAYIYDNSRYGTYHNTKLIGKGNRAKLDHYDRISILNLHAFIFLRLESSEQPNDLTKEFLQKSGVTFKATKENQDTITKLVSKPRTVKAHKSKSNKIAEISQESSRKTRSSLKNKSKSEKDIDPENIISTKRSRK